MSDDLESIKGRLVVGRKRDGRSVYDPTAKAQLVELCLRPGASVSRLARECGVNANQLSRWLRERGGVHVASRAAEPSSFVAVPLLPSPAKSTEPCVSDTCAVSLQARLPNGVALELRATDAHIGKVIEALGRLRCSVSTKA